MTFAAFVFASLFATATANDQIITLTPELLAGLPRTSVTVHVHGSKQESAYEGVTLNAILEKAGVASGEAIRGKKLSIVVIARASDGYQAVYALPELDPAFSRKLFLLADRKDGQPLPAAEGPFRLIVPDEMRPARWVRQVTSLVIRQIL